MTPTSEDLKKAAYESIWNYQTITEKEQVVAREFFYRGALWGALLQRQGAYSGVAGGCLKLDDSI